MSEKPKRPPLRYHGGKWRAADKIIPLFPKHMTYVEPFGGGASILLLKQRSKNEIYNDLDSDIVNVFKVLREPEQSQRLVELLELTPFSRNEMEIGWEETDDPIEQARRCIVRSRLGFGSAGATKGRTGFRGLDRCENSFSAPARQWDGLPKHLASVIERMKGVIIENTDAKKLIGAVDSESTLYYVDPPYVHSTRSSVSNSQKYYRHEMSDEEHEELLEILAAVKGKVVLSGYRSELYERYLKNWNMKTFASRASSAQGTVIKEECVWTNFDPDPGLF